MTRKKTICCECASVLKKDEKALCQKLFGEDTEDFYCLPCLSVYLECSQEDLEIKIMEFKEQGCALFF